MAVQLALEVGTQQRQLDVFIGRWKVEGHNRAGAPLHPHAHVTGDESYAWLPGGFFIEGQWNHRFADAAHAGTSILGVDAISETHVIHNFDNLGYARTYTMRARGRTWTLTGERERATYVFSDDGSEMTARWEISKNGATWDPLCDLALTRTLGIEELTRRYFRAYETKDRRVVEALLSRDFSFTSPFDIPPIDRAGYFERCWPGSATTRAIRIERVLELDNEAVVRYEIERTNGETFQNMEVLRFEGDRLVSVQVYFGECPARRV
jgi:ketosteroid isomerase-like protein